MCSQATARVEGNRLSRVPHRGNPCRHMPRLSSAPSIEIATLAFSRPMCLLVEKKHDFPRADSYRSYNTRAAGPERVSFLSFGADPEGSPLDKWVAAWLGQLEP